MAEIKGDFRKFMDKSFFGSWDIEGDEMVVTIEKAEVDDVQNERGKEKKLTLHLVGYKPIILNVTNGTNIGKALGSNKVEDWSGHDIILYKETVRAFGSEVDAVRVRPYAPKKNDIICEVCGQPITAAYNKSPRQMAEYTREKYGKQMCAECAKKEAE